MKGVIFINTYRIFSIVCYPDSSNLSYNSVSSLLFKTNLSYFIIFHDKDENKPHYHISIYSKKPTTLSVISKKLNVPENYIKVHDDFGKRYTLKNTIGYLIHYNSTDKYNYDINSVITDNIDLLNKYYDVLTGGSSEQNDLKDILLFIENNICSSKDLLKYCIENNYLKTFKKYSYYLNQVIKEVEYERRNY